MKGIFEKWHMPPNGGTVLMLLVGVLLQMADGSPFSLKAKWNIVWATDIPSEFFSLIVQKIIKSMLAVIVVIRCATTYAYVVSAMLVVFCVTNESSPKLMLLWLFVSGVKSVCMTFSEAIIGVYVCSAFREIHKACFEFFISKAIELIFAAYLWGNILNVYQEMERKATNNKQQTSKRSTKEQIVRQKTECVRQRARSLVDESTLSKTARLNNFEFRDVPQIILQMCRRGDEMSQDSLLSSGMMLASVSNLGSFDDLKITHSLGEVGILNLETTEVFGIDEDEPSTPQEKALRFLKLTQSDVLTIKLNRTPITNDIYAMDSDIWKGVAASRHDLNKPKKARTQVFIHEYTPLDLRCDSANVRNIIKRETYKFNFCSSVFLNEVESAIDEDDDDDDELFDDSYSVIEEEEILSQDERDERNKKWVQLFMSNRKEGRVFRPTVFGFRLKKLKKNTFAKLCNEVSMNMIGSEVFDRAPKLLRITSLSVINKKTVKRCSASLSAVSVLQKARQDEHNKESPDSDSESEKATHVYFISAIESLSREKVKNIQRTDSVEEEIRPGVFSQIGSDWREDNEKVGPDKTDQVNPSNLSLSGNHEESQDDFIYRKKRMVIKRLGKKRARTKLRTGSVHSQNQSSSDFSAKDSSSSQNPSSSDNMMKQSSEEGLDKTENSPSNEKTNGEGKDPKSRPNGCNRHIYFLMQLFEKPFSDVIEIYQNLKNELNTKKGRDSLRRQKKEFTNFPRQNYYLKSYGRRLKSHGSIPKRTKVWKSNVLNAVELLNRKSTKSALNVSKTGSLSIKIVDDISFHSNNSSATQFEVKDWVNSNLKSSGSFEISTSDVSITSELESQVTLNEPEWEKHKIEKTSSSSDSWKSGAATHDEFISISSGSNCHMSISIIKRDKKPGEGSSAASTNKPEGDSVVKKESEEPISLYYSQAASLASPLFDMKRFIYPDHIHYSYKHVKKKGFDVNINGAFPLFLRRNLTAGKPLQKGNKLILKKPEITKRPMDLSFAKSDAFAKQQNNQQVDVDEKYINTSAITSRRKKEFDDMDWRKNKKPMMANRLKKSINGNDSNSLIQSHTNSKPHDGYSNTMKCLRSAKDRFLEEKIQKLEMQLNGNNCEAPSTESGPVQISLNSNKGRIDPTCNPATSPQQNKTSKGKIITESQRRRILQLAREAFLQRKSLQDKLKQSRETLAKSSD